MAIDEDNHRVPVAFLLFSAPSGNAHTALGYDTKILTTLLQKWKESLKTFQPGHKYVPPIATTDTDLKERNALVNVFPIILLLICRVHLRRSWKNHRTKSVKGDSPTASNVRSRLKTVEERLVHTTTYSVACSLIEDEITAFEEEASEMENSPYRGGVIHLMYLLSYWLANEHLWASWSDFGRHTAAKILSCPTEKVPMHTNHLEAFNRVLKHGHIGNQMHGGRRLRLDSLLHFVVLDMVPSIFDQRTMERAENQRQKNWVLSLPGGTELWSHQQTSSASSNGTPVAFLILDSA
ncbi:hypothetical protein GGU11DRAFT_750115 [Lentinula aff. detonsa]|nr:hypothetical protein GGU11DRAFT_750115 [Lentinula aff. detonsa]